MDFLSLPGIADPHTWLSFLVLAALEIVLGIDNLLFIAILTERLPERRRALARRLGQGLPLFLARVLGDGGVAEPLGAPPPQARGRGALTPREVARMAALAAVLEFKQ